VAWGWILPHPPPFSLPRTAFPLAALAFDGSSLVPRRLRSALSFRPGDRYCVRFRVTTTFPLYHNSKPFASTDRLDGHCSGLACFVLPGALVAFATLAFRFPWAGGLRCGQLQSTKAGPAFATSGSCLFSAGPKVFSFQPFIAALQPRTAAGGQNLASDMTKWSANARIGTCQVSGFVQRTAANPARSGRKQR